MITDFFLDIGMSLIGWVLSWMVAPEGGFDFLADVATIIAPVFANIHGLGAWVPWPLVVTVVGSIFTLWAVFALVKFVTWVKSLFWAGS